MPAFLHNKYLRLGLAGLGGVLVLVLTAAALQSLFGLGGYQSSGFPSAPKYDGGFMDGTVAEVSPGMAPRMHHTLMEADDMAGASSHFLEPPTHPQPDGYLADLERYETTSHQLSARTSNATFTALCDTLLQLKTDDEIHFKQLTTGHNHCDARFFVAEHRIASVLEQFESYRDLTNTRHTHSVTRHKEQIERQSDIVRQQLASVEQTLTEAERAYDDIVAFARANHDSETLHNAINNKLRQIDQLTQRKITLVAQLETHAQQSADLAERLNVIEVLANFSRQQPIEVGKHNHWWSAAWEQLHDQFTKTLIGVTAFFGVFLLYVVQYGLYLLVLIVVARYGWKVVRHIWRL